MKKLVLLVDDEALIREMLTQMLSRNGYRVVEASSPHEAEKAVRQETPDLIISDLKLEESDGLAMIAQLKTLRPDVPVILLTGVFFDTEVVRDSLSKVVTSYLPKTTPLARILTEVKRLAPIGSAMSNDLT